MAIAEVADRELLEECIGLAADGTRSHVGRLLAGWDGYIGASSRWTGRYSRADQYHSHDVGWLLGRLWVLYTHTGDAEFSDMALRILRPMIPDLTERPIRSLGSGVDIYFGLCVGAEVTGSDELHHHALVASANLIDSLWDESGGRFLPVAGLTDEMPLEFGGCLYHLLWSGREQPEHLDMFVRHQQKVLAVGLVREDGSTAHIAHLDNEGHVTRYATGQGWRDDSTWARGQSWALHNFTAGAVVSGRSDLRETAERLARWWLKRVPADWVPAYDFDDPEPGRPRDSCAAAMSVSALMRFGQPGAPALLPGTAQAIDGTINELCRNYVSVGGVVVHGSMGFMRGQLYGYPVSNESPQPGDPGVNRTRFPQEDILPYGNYFVLEAIHRKLSGQSAFPPLLAGTATSSASTTASERRHSEE